MIIMIGLLAITTIVGVLAFGMACAEGTRTNARLVDSFKPVDTREETSRAAYRGRRLRGATS